MKFAFGGRTATKSNTKEGSHSPLSFELPLSVTESLIGIFLTRVNLVLRVRIRQYDIIYEVKFPNKDYDGAAILIVSPLSGQIETGIFFMNCIHD